MVFFHNDARVTRRITSGASYCSVLRRLTLAVVLIATMAVTPGCVLPFKASSFPGAPDPEADAYLDAWERGEVAAQRAMVATPPADFEVQHSDWRKKLAVVASRFERKRTERAADGGAIVSFRAVHSLRGLGEWRFDSQLRFKRDPAQARWLLQWSPAVLHPEARAGDNFIRSRTWAPRAHLLDDSGRPLTQTLAAKADVVTVGIRPQRAQDRPALLDALHLHLGIDPEALAATLAKPDLPPDAFIPVIDLEADRYQQMRPTLAPIAGIFFRKQSTRAPVIDGFASHTLGRVGAITAEALTSLGPPYQAGDIVGLTGLEAALEAKLAGGPSGQVVLIRASGPRTVLHRFAGTPPQDVRTTLRYHVQAAAEGALARVTTAAALVAIDAASGDVVAIASRPISDGFHRALIGLYPPGSTFKVVTADALIRANMKPATPLSCPAEVSVGSVRFRNFQGEALGKTTFKHVFAHSCNTAFVMQATQLGNEALQAAAERFGFGVSYNVGLPAPQASFPKPQSAPELAAAAIGQGRVITTPLHMASVAAAVGSGKWRAPRLFATDETRPTSELGERAAETLQLLMRAAVAEGTGKAAATVSGLMGKTGTAEFGTDTPPATHAWFVGLYEGIGFAVFVEAGGVGGQVAAPIAARFASAIAQSR